MTILGIDLGGTKIAVAAVAAGRILTRHRVDTPRTGGEAVLDAMARAAREVLMAHPEIRAVGVGSPGPIDFARGVVLFAPNIPGLEEAPLVAGLQERLSMPVALENDANAAGLAEHLYGAAKGADTSIFVTMSTGIGGGIFVSDRVLRGRHGLAGEIGHMTLQPGGPLCGCGYHGCWESIASGRAIAREASFSYCQGMTTVEVFRRARAGEWRALKVVDNAAHYSGLALANLMKAFDPDLFVIGGGMSQVGPFYLDKIQAAADAYTLGFPQLSLRTAELGVDAGVIGAASVAGLILG
ncbi:ROK family protein [soil metagenome]